MGNDSVKKTLIVAFLLCVVCSILVSGSAVSLKDKQVANQKLDIKKNLLSTAGLLKGTTPAEVEEAFQAVETKVIDLKSGEYVDVDPETFDQYKAAKMKGQFMTLENDIAKIGNIAKYSKVFLIKENGVVSKVALPVHGKGLWSTMKGFLILKADTVTVDGLGFYSHGETPGLGGEIDNPNWKAIWPGKKAFDADSNVALKVIKGAVNPSSPTAMHEVDGLSGATITANGVTATVQFWLGKEGFGSYLSKLKVDLLPKVDGEVLEAEGVENE